MTFASDYTLLDLWRDRVGGVKLYSCIPTLRPHQAISLNSAQAKLLIVANRLSHTLKNPLTTPKTQDGTLFGEFVEGGILIKSLD